MFCAGKVGKNRSRHLSLAKEADVSQNGEGSQSQGWPADQIGALEPDVAEPRRSS